DRYHLDGYIVDKNRYPVETSITRDIQERLIGGTVTGILTGVSPATSFSKKYYIYNTDVHAIKIKLKFNGLFQTFLTGLSTAGETCRQNVYISFQLGRVYKDGSEDAAPNPKFHRTRQRYFSTDAQNYRGKITQPMLVTYTFFVRSHQDDYVYFPVLPQQIGWTITVSKRSADWNDSFLQNIVIVDSITEVFSERFTYPNSAMVYSKFDARYFNAIPKRSYKMRLLKVKVPSNYDPITKTYDKSWNGKFKLAWTDNPAWCFYDIISNNRYGLGKYFKSNYLDKWNLYEIAQYCDQLVPDGLGGLEPRFTCNIHINTKAEAYKVLNDMASIFNGILYYSAGQILVNQDSEKNPIYLFNNSNV
ncbi:hypothetical protein EBU71_22950, partial [bacterium]|nr:hypothetical protein [Candidatus Elulimicrobium humile]